MIDFSYIARDLAGQKLTGVIAAPSEREAITLLSGKSLFPIELTAHRKAQALSFNRVKPQLVSTTYGQLAGLLRSGVPMLRAIAVLRDQTSNTRLRDVMASVHSEVENGVTLADAMARHPKVFTEIAVNLVRAGGEGGFIEDALDRIATFTEQQEDLKSQVIGALAYPCILATIGSIVVTVLIVFFVPNFEPLFAGLRKKGELPVMTDILMSISGTLGSWWGLGIFVIMVSLAIAAYAQLQTERGKVIRDAIKLRLPGVGKIFLSLAVARFCRVLGTLLSNGVPILRSLEISSEATGNRILATAIQDAGENITAGESLAAPLGVSGHFPPTIVEMISVAEESNTLDTVLVNIADTLEKRTWRQLELFVRFLEPLLLLFLAGAVLSVAIGLLLPVLRMSSIVQ